MSKNFDKGNSQTKTKNKRWILILCIVVEVVALVVLGGFLILSHFGVFDSKEDVKANSNVSSSISASSDDSEINPIDAEKYYKENGEIISITDYKDAKELNSEKEVYTLLKERGFAENPIYTDFSENGEYLDQQEIDKNSDKKYPMYHTSYVSSNGDYWIIDVINGCITASSLNYSVTNEDKVQILFCESNDVIGYDNVSNKFFKTVPKENFMTLKKVSKINAQTLNQISEKGVDKW